MRPFFSVYVSIYQPTNYLSISRSVCLSIYLPVYLQAWKLSKSARRPQFLNLTTSKPKQFCETSAVFELASLQDFFNFWTWQHQQRSNSARLPSKIEVKCSADSLVPMRFAIFPLHLSKVLRLPRKSDARSYEVLHLSRNITLANLKIWCSKMLPLSGNQRPDLLTSLVNMSLVLRLAREMHLCRSSSTPANVFETATKPARFALF